MTEPQNRGPKPRTLLAEPERFGRLLEPPLAAHAAEADQYDVVRCLIQNAWVFELRSHLAVRDGDDSYALADRLTPVFMAIDELNGFKTRAQQSLAESRSRLRETRPDYEDPRGKDEERRLRRSLRLKLDGEQWMALRDFVLWQVMFGSAWFPEMDTLVPTLRLPEDLPDGVVRRRLEEVGTWRSRRRGELGLSVPEPEPAPKKVAEQPPKRFRPR